ncbi:MAG: ATP synthase F1 subunit gamma [Angelakisella sp.]|nr:ATP synthase F1 subunit gamma [Angelakisella sp.]
MASARDIQNRIKSVQDTMKITNAMYLISSTKVKKARRALTEATPHFEQSERLIAEILRDLPELEDRFFGTAEPISGGKKGYLILSGDKGLAGAYNHNITKFAESVLSAEEEPVVYVVGQMGSTALQKAGYEVNGSFDGIAQHPTVERARIIAATLCEEFVSGRLCEVDIIFTYMRGGVEAIPLQKKLLPLSAEAFRLTEDEPQTPQEVVYLPDAKAVLGSIAPNYLTGYVFGALVEAFCSEENARMLAMKSATDSAGDMLRELSVIYNSVRQAAITQQIVEVAGGAKAQKRKKTS